MSSHVYKQIELTGSSKTSLEDAVTTAITKAGQTVHNLRWFEVTKISGHLENQKVAHWR